MKKSLRFVFVVAGFTFATFSSVSVHANKASLQNDVCTCDDSAATCGYTNDGKLITGLYRT